MRLFPLGQVTVWLRIQLEWIRDLSCFYTLFCDLISVKSIFFAFFPLLDLLTLKKQILHLQRFSYYRWMWDIWTVMCFASLLFSSFPVFSLVCFTFLYFPFRSLFRPFVHSVHPHTHTLHTHNPINSAIMHVAWKQKATTKSEKIIKPQKTKKTKPTKEQNNKPTKQQNNRTKTNLSVRFVVLWLWWSDCDVMWCSLSCPVQARKLNFWPKKFSHRWWTVKRLTFSFTRYPLIVFCITQNVTALNLFLLDLF